MNSGVVFLILRIFIALALYAFLVTVAVTIWQDLRRQAGLHPQAAQYSLILRYKIGETSSEIGFSPGEITLGRDTLNDITLPSDTVSSRHARIYYEKGQWWLEDLGSTNGTYLQDYQIQHPTVLTNGDTIRCGDVEINVQINT